MNFERELVKHADAIVELQARVDRLEQASTPRANSEQSVVSPPNVVDSENPALARPATIAEIKTSLEKTIAAYESLGGPDWNWGFAAGMKIALQRLNDLDQWPIASKPPVRSSRKQWESPVKPTES